jgi:hypothetical protein
VRVLLDENMPESVRIRLRRMGYETVRSVDVPATVKVIRVALPQESGGRFTRAFLAAFEATDWARYPNGSDWP